jgi:hypothetical protein
MCEEPWEHVVRSGRRRGVVQRGGGSAVLGGGACGAADEAYFVGAREFVPALFRHFEALACNTGLVGAIWHHLRAWRGGLAASLQACSVVCVGLGSVSRQGPSGPSLVQLALLLLLHRLARHAEMNVQATPGGPPEASELLEAALEREVEGQAPIAEAVDPCFTPTDVALLGSVGVRGHSRPWRGPGGAEAVAAAEAAQPGGQPALLFMPHCPAALYTAALVGFHWRGAEEGGREEGGAAAEVPSTLPHLPLACIVGNGFQEYLLRRGVQLQVGSGGEPTATAKVPSWGPGLRQRVAEALALQEAGGSGGSGGGSAGCAASLEERSLPLELDAVAAVYRRCCAHDGGGAPWRMRCTALEPLVTPQNSRELPGVSLLYSAALSTTYMHSVEWGGGE